MWLKCLLEQSSMWLTSSSTTVCAILALMYMLNPLQVLLHTQLECSNRGVRHLQFNMNLLMPFLQSLCCPDTYVGRNVCHQCKLSIILIVSVFLTGMQVGYFLERAGRDYIIFEKGPTAGM